MAHNMMSLYIRDVVSKKELSCREFWSVLMAGGGGLYLSVVCTLEGCLVWELARYQERSNTVHSAAYG